MASAIFTYSTSGPGVQGNLTIDNDGAYVAAGIVVGSTDSTAIAGSASYHYVTIAGTLIGDTSGVVLGDDPANDRNERVNVRAGAEVFGYHDSGIQVTGQTALISNYGYVYGGQFSVRIYALGSISTISNSGEIEGDIIAIANDYRSTGGLVVNNSGTIRGGICFLDASESTDRIYNSGTMIGDVNMGGGADLYDGRSGHVEDSVNGELGNDTIYGGLDNDRISGGMDADTIEGGAGGDNIDGGSGADSMAGGTGDDRYYVDVAADKIVETSNQGIDVVFSNVNYTLGANLESLSLEGTGTINGTGNTLDNVLGGNGAINTLQGGDGNDTILGSGGADRLYGGRGSDVFTFLDTSDSSLAARDGIYDFVEGSTDRIDLSRIDANANLADDQAFTLVSAYTGVAGQLRAFTSGSVTYVEGDVNGDRRADFQIVVSGVHSLQQGDFVL